MKETQDTDKAAPGISRRAFMQTGAGLGFAVAALPVSGQTVQHTDSAGLTAGLLHLEIDGQQVPVYRAQPQGKSALPVVLVVSEIFGLHEHIADVARRFAKLGYLALAPELFIRQGDAASYPDVNVLLKEIIAKVPDVQVMRDLDAVLAWAGEHGGDLARVAVSGFCWGGRITWLYAAHNPAVKAGVAWYGRLQGQTSALSPQHPLDIAAALKTPVLGLYGGQDSGIPQASIAAMQLELAKGHSGSEFHIYPDAGHAFHADYRPSYVAADAVDSWKRCIAWLDKHGVAP